MSEENKILKNGQLLNAIRKNKTPEEKSKKILKYLNEGADVNTKDANNINNTPLHIAVLKGEPEIVKLLLDNGAIIENENSEHKTALGIAESSDTPNGEEIANILKVHFNRHSQPSNEHISLAHSSSLNNPVQEPQFSEKSSVPQQSRQNTSKDTTEEENPYFYSKRSGTSGVKGHLYETKLLTLLLFRALNHEKIRDFYIGTNIDKIGALDDIIFRYNMNGEDKPRIKCIQAKHKDYPDKDRVTFKELRNKDGNFSLCKYLDSYLRIRNRFKPETDDDLFKDKFSDVDCDCIIYTNAKQDLIKEKDVIFFNTNRDDLIYTIADGKTFPFEYEEDDINRLLNIISEVRAKLLGESLAKFIFSDKQNHDAMMSEHLIKCYHVLLAQKVIEVSDTESIDHRKGEFRPEFFDSKDDLLSILKKTLYKEMVAKHCMKSKLCPEEIKNLIDEILKSPSAETISKLIGNVITFDADSRRLKFIEKEIPQEIIHLKDDLEKIEVMQEAVEEAVEKAQRKILGSLSFKLPSTFGNLDFKVKNDRRLNYLVKKFIELLTDDVITRNNTVKIDDNMVDDGKILRHGELPKVLKYGDLSIKGGIGGLVGNLLILDDERNGLKFNNAESLPKNARWFFDKLQTQISGCEKLRDKDVSSYKLDINVSGFPRLSLNSEECDKKLLKYFLSKLKFYTSQANEDQVENILKAELYRHFYTDKKPNEFFFRIKIDAVFLKVHDKVQKWWMQPDKAPYLTKSCKYFEQAQKEVIDSPLLTILNSIYLFNVKQNQLQFSDNAIEALDLDTFIEKSNERILNIVAYEYILSSVKLAQYFETKDFNHAFMDLYCVSEICRYEEVISEFAAETPSILLIECKAHYGTRNISVEDLYEKLKGIIGKSGIKIILICKRNDILSEKFKQNFSENYIETEDDRNSFSDLTDESQSKLLDGRKVIFQGDEANLSTLIDGSLKHLIDREVLFKLINDEEVEIGKKVTDSRYEDIKDYYIYRNFNRVEIRKGFEEAKCNMGNDIFFITDSKHAVESNPDWGQDIILISDTKGEFNELCKKYKDHNIHWLKIEKNKFIWQETRGDVSKLRNFLIKDAENITPYAPRTITDITNKVVIIAAESGMGKSTVLTDLALKTKEADPSLWVLRINLVDYSDELEEQQENKTKFTKVEGRKFLYKTASLQLLEKKEKSGNRERVFEGLNLLEMELFNTFYSQGRIALLFDGFDEITPDYKEQIIELLTHLKGTGAQKMWITTRPYGFLRNLEDELSTFSHTLRPFSEQDKKHFFVEFWKTQLKLDDVDDIRVGIFANELCKRFSDSINDQEGEFVGIPLQIRMIAEIFQDTFKEFYDSKSDKLSYEHKQKLDEKMNLVDLYESFVKKKVKDIRFKEKLPEIYRSKPEMKSFIKKEQETFMQNHRKLAYFELFKHNKPEKLLSEPEISEILSLIEQGGEKSGIIDRVIDGKPYFIHSSFTEYFAASFLWEKFKSLELSNFEDILIKCLLKCTNLQTCKFLHLLAQKDFENSINFPDRESKVKILLKQLVLKIRTYGPQERNKEHIKLLLKIVEFFVSEENNLVIIRDVIHIDDNRKVALLCASAEMGYIRLAKELIRVPSEQHTVQFAKEYLRCDKWFYSPLWLAAKNNHLHFIKVVLFEKHLYDSTWNDKDDMNLLQRILQMDEFGVLRSCLKLGIIDVSGTYLGLNCEERSPLVDCITRSAPVDVIELLIEKTDIDFINQFLIDSLPAVVHIIGYLVPYDNNCMHSLIEKGIDMNASFYPDDGAIPINAIAYEFLTSSISVPEYFLGEPRFLRHFFYSHKEFSKFFDLVKSLLEYGAVYNLEDPYSNTVLQYVKQTHYIHKLLGAILQTSDKESVTVSNVLDKISDKMLQLMIKTPGLKYSDCFQGYKISIDSCSRKIEILPKYDYYKFFPDKRKNLNEPRLERVGFVPEYIQSLFFETCTRRTYKKNTQIKDALVILSVYVEKFRDVICKLKSGGYTVSDILEKLEQKEKISDISVTCLLERVLKFCIDQNYEISDAFNEVSEEAFKLDEKMQSYVRHVLTMKQQGHKERFYTCDEILNILGINDSNIEEDLMSKNNESGGIYFFHDILLQLNSVGQKYKEEILKSMFKYSEQSSQTFQLLQIIDDLFNDISSGNNESVITKFKNIKPSFIKAIVNARNKQGQTVLDVAYESYDAYIIKLLLRYGAKFGKDYLEEFFGSQVQKILSCCTSEENADEINAESEMSTSLA